MANFVKSMFCSSVILGAVVFAHGAPSAAQQSVGRQIRRPALRPQESQWQRQFEDTIALRDSARFIALLNDSGFSLINTGREDRAGDVGVWVRRSEGDPGSAVPALSLNMRKAKTLAADDITIGVRQGKKTVLKTLAERLAELGLSHKGADESVEVHWQLVVLPVPDAASAGPRQKFDPTLVYPDDAAPEFHATDDARSKRKDAFLSPRLAAVEPSLAAFNFSVSMDGTAAYVITDGPAGGGEAVVAGAGHRLLFANIGGKRAPAAASAAERASNGSRAIVRTYIDVEAPRHCVVQVPLNPRAKGLFPGDFQTPPKVAPAGATVFLDDRPPRPLKRPYGPGGALDTAQPDEQGKDQTQVVRGRPVQAVQADDAVKSGQDELHVMPPKSSRPIELPRLEEATVIHKPRFDRIKFVQGEPEGPYSAGGGFRGKRAPEPIRVTYVYFVSPAAGFSQADLDRLAQKIVEMTSE